MARGCTCSYRKPIARLSSECPDRRNGAVHRGWCSPPISRSVQILAWLASLTSLNEDQAERWSRAENAVPDRRLRVVLVERMSGGKSLCKHVTPGSHSEVDQRIRENQGMHTHVANHRAETWSLSF
jgi:hypothetical protein